MYSQREKPVRFKAMITFLCSFFWVCAHVLSHPGHTLNNLNAQPLAENAQKLNSKTKKTPTVGWDVKSVCTAHK